MTANQEVASKPEQSQATYRYRADVDIFETQQELVLRMDLPGAAADSVDVQFDDGELQVRARVPSRDVEGGTLLVGEYGVGGFQRSFRVRDTVDASAISADLSDGVLTLRLPKLPEASARRIPVNAV